MSRVLSAREVARAFRSDARDVDRWVQEGCPHFHLRALLLVFDRDEVAQWLVRSHPPDVCTLLAGRFLARTLEDMAALFRELGALLANGSLDPEEASEIQADFRTLAREIRSGARRP